MFITLALRIYNLNLFLLLTPFTEDLLYISMSQLCLASMCVPHFAITPKNSKYCYLTSFFTTTGQCDEVHLLWSFLTELIGNFLCMTASAEDIQISGATIIRERLIFVALCKDSILQTINIMIKLTVLKVIDWHRHIYTEIYVCKLRGITYGTTEGDP